LARANLRLPELDAIVFGQGPGSFTGLRTACSVAQGLAFGAGVPVLPVETLMAVAEEARARHGIERVVAVLDARMDEVYSASYEHAEGRWRRSGEIHLGAPEAVTTTPGWAQAGNAFSAYANRLPFAAVRIDALPTAAALLRLAPALLAAGQAVPAAHALPLYIRDKVAQTTEERAAARAATNRP
jgi:tRNA threonylcarbamoyladenosine biosynthesis protein TsaB